MSTGLTERQNVLDDILRISEDTTRQLLSVQATLRIREWVRSGLALEEAERVDNEAPCV